MPLTFGPVLAVLFGVCCMFSLSPMVSGYEERAYFAAAAAPSPSLYNHDVYFSTMDFGPQSTSSPTPGVPESSELSHEWWGDVLENQAHDDGPALDLYLSGADATGQDYHIDPPTDKGPDGFHQTYFTDDAQPKDLSTELYDMLDPEMPQVYNFNTYYETEGHSEGDTSGPDSTTPSDLGSSSMTSENQSTPGFRCKDCGRVFSTMFTLKRHQGEQHAGQVERFPCPHSACKNSQAKAAFKREANLLRHLQICKHKPSDAGSSSGSQAASSPEESIPFRKVPSQDMPGSKKRKREATSNQMGESSDNEQLISGLRKKYKARLAALEARERELQEEREILENLAACIRNLEEEEDED